MLRRLRANTQNRNKKKKTELFPLEQHEVRIHTKQCFRFSFCSARTAADFGRAREPRERPRRRSGDRTHAQPARCSDCGRSPCGASGALGLRGASAPRRDKLSCGGSSCESRSVYFGVGVCVPESSPPRGRHAVGRGASDGAARACVSALAERATDAKCRKKHTGDVPPFRATLARARDFLCSFFTLLRRFFLSLSFVYARRALVCPKIRRRRRRLNGPTSAGVIVRCVNISDRAARRSRNRGERMKERTKEAAKSGGRTCAHMHLCIALTRPLRCTLAERRLRFAAHFFLSARRYISCRFVSALSCRAGVWGRSAASVNIDVKVFL